MVWCRIECPLSLKSDWTFVPLNNVIYVDNLKDIIKVRFSPLLDGYSSSMITLEARLRPNEGRQSQAVPMHLKGSDHIAKVVRHFENELLTGKMEIETNLNDYQRRFGLTVALYIYIHECK